MAIGLVLAQIFHELLSDFHSDTIRTIMLIEIRRFATLPPHTPENDRLDVAEGTTAGEAMHILNIRSAETLILVNGVHAGPDRILNDGDRLAFVPAAEAANS